MSASQISAVMATVHNSINGGEVNKKIKIKNCLKHQAFSVSMWYTFFSVPTELPSLGQSILSDHPFHIRFSYQQVHLHSGVEASQET